MSREFLEEASGKNLFPKLALGRRGVLNGDSERKAISAAVATILVFLLRRMGATEKFFFVLLKVASTNASSRFNLQCFMQQVMRQQLECLFQLSAALPLL
jgi:hypothetical protein